MRWDGLIHWGQLENQLAVDYQKVVELAIWAKNGKLTKLDPQTGKPIQIRSYDAKGNPVKDIDFGHNHGFGDPHAHDWKYPSDKAPNKVRGEGRVLTKMEKI